MEYNPADLHHAIKKISSNEKDRVLFMRTYIQQHLMPKDLRLLILGWFWENN